MLKEIEKTVLSKAREEKNAVEIAKQAGVELSSVMSALESLKEKGLVEARVEVKSVFSLTHDGLEAIGRGLPERKLCNVLEEKKQAGMARIGMRECREMISARPAVQGGLREEEFVIALKWGKELGLVAIVQGQLELSSVKKTPHELLLEKVGKKISESQLSSEEKAVLVELERRKLVERKIEKTVFVKATPAGVRALEQEPEGAVTQLTPQLLKTGGWKGKQFVAYDVKTLVAPFAAGKKHAYKQFLLEIKQKLVGMGFVEAHGPLVEMEFWNMDALFMAQDHPAREIHDVFQVEDPARGEILDKKLLENVRKAHEKGLGGSKGWRYKWDPEVASRLVLRSHTTPVSARNLAKGLKPPQRIFCIGRVFRPDEIDWKHFIEFNQCEGIVVDESMSFRELLGYLKEFAIEVFGAQDVRFVPDYFPFTEPSVEMHAKIPGKGWAEVGGAGMFRPEMLSALGVDVPVLAWGLGIDRLAMIKLGTKDIRDLFSQDLKLLRHQ
ncbi:MAG: phenylalanine--tRNA ligase subunit alpha [Candidatus Micrarchaeota archaeon]